MRFYKKALKLLLKKVIIKLIVILYLEKSEKILYSVRERVFNRKNVCFITPKYDRTDCRGRRTTNK
jgi:hypothetical protein